MNEPADQTDPEFLEELLFRCLDSADPQATADALSAEHPHVADRLRRVLSRLETQGFVGEETQTASEPSAESADVPEQLGQFKILSRLGAGGMGVVYLAEDEKLGRKVAVKLVRPEQLYLEGARDRFQREIEAIARLQHPGIVRIHGVGEEDGVPYFSMDYVRGISLARLIANLTGMDPARLRTRDFDSQVESTDAQSDSSADGSWNRKVIHIVRDIADALAHAHAQGVLHRDVKPSNILIGEDRRPRLLDFGLALTDDGQDLTRSNAQLGSLPYTAPEQIAGNAQQEPGLDVYALGVTMYELLTLRSPFLGPTAEETRSNILAATPAPLRSLNSTVSLDVETVCLTAMDPAPTRRYVSMTALIADLDNLLEHRPIIARPMGRWFRALRWCQRHPASTVAIAAAVLVFALSVGFALYFFQEERRSRETNYLLGITAAASQIVEGRPGEAIASLKLCPEDLRGFEWEHYWLRTRGYDTVYRGHTSRVIRLAVHPDGKEFVSRGIEGTLRFWRVGDVTAQRVVELPSPTRGGTPFCVYSADGQHVLASGEQSVVWRIQRDGSEAAVFAPLAGVKAAQLAAHPNGRQLAVADTAGGLHLFDLEGGALRAVEITKIEQVSKFLGPPVVLALEYSRDGRWLAAARRNRVAIIDVAEGREVWEIVHAKGDVVTTILFASDGKSVVTSGSFADSRRHDLATGKGSGTGFGDKGVNVIVEDPATGRFILGRIQGLLDFLDDDFVPLYRLLGHEGTVTGAAILAETRQILTSSYDGTIRSWPLDATPAAEFLGRHRGVVRSMCVTPDGRFAIAAGSDGKVCRWGLEGGPMQVLHTAPRGGVWSLDLTASGDRLAVAESKGLRLLGLPDGVDSRAIEVDVAPRFVSWFPDGRRLAVAAADRQVLVVDSQTGEVQYRTRFGEAGGTVELRVLPWNGNLVIALSTGEVGVLDGGDLSVHKRLQAHDWRIRSLGLDLGAQRILTGDVQGRIRFFDESLVAQRPDALWRDEVISSIAVSPKRQRVLTSTMMRQIAIWDRPSMKRLARLRGGHNLGIMVARFTPDGNSIVSGRHGRDRTDLALDAGRIPALTRPSGPTGTAESNPKREIGGYHPLDDG